MFLTPALFKGQLYSKCFLFLLFFFWVGGEEVRGGGGGGHIVLKNLITAVVDYCSELTQKIAYSFRDI